MPPKKDAGKAKGSSTKIVEDKVNDLPATLAGTLLTVHGLDLRHEKR
jgi:hypothetical protein